MNRVVYALALLLALPGCAEDVLDESKLLNTQYFVQQQAELWASTTDDDSVKEARLRIAEISDRIVVDPAAALSTPILLYAIWTPTPNYIMVYWIEEKFEVQGMWFAFGSDDTRFSLKDATQFSEQLEQYQPDSYVRFAGVRIRAGSDLASDRYDGRYAVIDIPENVDMGDVKVGLIYRDTYGPAVHVIGVNASVGLGGL